MLRPGVTARATAVALALALVAGCGGSEEDPAPDQIAAESPARAVDSPACSSIHFAGAGRPSVLIVSDLPLQGIGRVEALQLSQGIDLILEQRRFRAGRFRVGYQVCDDATATSDLSDPDRCAALGRAFARTPDVVGVIGPYLSLCAAALLPVLNEGSAGRLAVISGSATYIGLTKDGTGTAPGHPGRLYPTGRRNFLRVAIVDDAQGAANALMAQRTGADSVFVLDDGSLYGQGVAASFDQAARARGLRVAGRRAWDADAPSYARLAEAIARTGADAVFLGGLLAANGARLVRDLRSHVPDATQLLAPDGFGPPAALVQRAGAASEGMTITKPDVPRSVLTARGRAFYEAMRVRTGKVPCCYTLYGAQAAEVLLDAIAASDGTRASVLANLRRTRVPNGLMGGFSFDENGDTTLQRVYVHRIQRGELTYVTAITPPQGMLDG
jgi:branched-chain amino acid transport system substrate-binding protein